MTQLAWFAETKQGKTNNTLYTVYILKSEIARKTYVGYTSDIEKRLKEHNQGMSKFTKNFTPWKIIYTEKCKNQLGAIARERYLKSAAGRRWIKKQSFINL